MTRTGRFVVAAALAVSALAGAGVAARALADVRPLGRLPLWDEAGNLWGAAELVSALADGRPLDFVARANAQDKWPFGFSLMLAPLVALDADRAAAALLPALAFALVAPLLVWTGREAGGGSRGAVAGLIGAALWLSSPLALALGTVVLRETVGAALGVAALAAWLRARRLGTLAAWRLVGALLLALLWVKYNYFVMSAAAFALHAALELTPEERRAALARARTAIAGGGRASPARWLAIVAGAVTLTLVAGRNPGNLLYGALVIATGVALVRLARGRWRPRVALGRLSAPARGLVEFLAVPVWLWCLSPSPIHPRAVFSFLRNREGHAAWASWEALAYYPQVLRREGLPGGVLGGCALVAAAAGLVLLARRGDAARGVAATAAVALVALELHPLKEARFLVTALPVLALLAGLAFARLAGGPGRRGSGLPGWAILLAAASLAVLGGARAVELDRAGGRLEHDHAQLTADPLWRGPLAEVVTRVNAPAALLGGFNELSESLVRWQAWRGSGREAPLAGPPRGLTTGDDAERIARALARWLARERPRRIVSLRPLTGSRVATSGDYRRWNSWQLEALRQLGADPSWQRRATRRFGAAGVEVTTWVRRERGERPAGGAGGGRRPARGAGGPA